MRRVLVAMLLMGSAAPVLAEECLDVVGAPTDALLDAALTRSVGALANMQERTLTLSAPAAEDDVGKGEKVSGREGARPAKKRAIGADVLPGHQAQVVADLHSDNLRALEIVEREHVLARLYTPAGSCRYLRADKNFKAALGHARLSAERTSQYSAQYGLYIGPNFSLGGAGDWRPGAETLARFDTEVFTERDEGYDWLKSVVPQSGWLRGYSEISYQSINALEEASETTSEPVPADNMFASAGGYLRLNTGLQVHFTNWYGIQFGGGLSSLPNSDNVTRMEPRAFGGLHFETLFRDGALAQFFIGAAYDEFWQREVFDDPNDPLGPTHVEEHYARYNVDGLIFFPGQAGNFHLAGRLFADAPIDGKGPSDLRVSILVYYDFNDWLNSFVPIRSATSVADTLRGGGL